MYKNFDVGSLICYEGQLYGWKNNRGDTSLIKLSSKFYVTTLLLILHKENSFNDRVTKNVVYCVLSASTGTVGWLSRRDIECFCTIL